MPGGAVFTGGQYSLRHLIRVVAVNPAGSSLPAEVSVTLPPLPDISQVNMVSLEYSLSRGVQLQGRIQLTVTLEV